MVVSHWSGVAILSLVIVLFHIGIIASPGFFSHDEWQRFDFVSEHGLWRYVQVFGRLHSGPEFGHPIRPLGFIQEGISTLWMKSLPFIPHLIDVSIHVVISLLLVHALLVAGSSWAGAYLAGLLFGLSPLTTMATGWVAASFDQLYALFTVLVAIEIIRIARSGMTPVRTGVMILMGACAILSKETALVLPVVALLVFLAVRLARRDLVVPWKTVMSAVVLLMIPLLVYLVIRFPAIIQTLFGKAHASYTPNILNAPKNVLHYFAYPFLLNTADLNSGALDPLGLSVGVALHSLLLYMLVRRFGRAFFLLYLASYFVFLTPVISLPVMGSHYLNGSAFSMAVAMAALLIAEWKDRRIMHLSLVSSLTLLTFVHAAYSQGFIYRTALCQTTFLDSLDVRMAIERSKGNSRIVIRSAKIEPGCMKAIFGRDRYSGTQGVAVNFEAGPLDTYGKGVVLVHMDEQCLVK